MLEHWLGHIAPERFFEEFWGQREAFLPIPTAVPVPFSLNDFEQLLNQGRLRFPQVQCFDGGRVIDPLLYTRSGDGQLSEEIDARGVHTLALQHKTVRITNLQAVHPGLRELGALLEQHFGCAVKINAYYCVGPAGGLDGHYDTHHIFAVQLTGRKVWNLGPVVIDTPDRDFRPNPLTDPPIVKRVAVDAGYMLYVPPGQWHEVFTEDVSLHLTIGFHPPTWTQALEKLLQAARQKHPILRAALPFALDDDRCVYRLDVQEELSQLVELLKLEVPPTMAPMFRREHAGQPVSLPAPAGRTRTPVFAPDSDLAKALDEIWVRAGSPVALYLRGNIPVGAARTSWDLDVVMVVAAMDPATGDRIAGIPSLIAERYPLLPQLDLRCCTREELLTAEHRLLTRILLAETGVHVRGEDILRELPALAYGPELAGTLRGQMRQAVDYRLKRLGDCPPEEVSARMAALCKLVLRCAAVPVMREESRFVRDPVACFAEAVRRFPERCADAELMLERLHGQQVPREQFIPAAERLAGRLLG